MKSFSDDTAQERKVTETDDNHTANLDKSISVSNQADICTNRDFNLDSIVACAKSLDGHGVTSGGMTGKDIKDVLGPVTAPDLRILEQKKIFFSIRSNQMREVTRLYKTDDTLCDQK